MNISRLCLALFLVSSQNLWADASATWRCVGEKVILNSQKPYMGENSRFAQTLFTLSKKEVTDGSVDTAFFLKVTYDTGLFGQQYIDGKNEVGGKFELFLSGITDISDGTTIRKKSAGTLSYSQGPTLKGIEEKVSCIFE